VASPRLWSVDSPELYVATVEVLLDGQVVDSLSSNVGIRSIELHPERGLLLNGVETKLRGANLHNDHGPLGAVALDRSEQRRVELLKAAGFNAYRVGHVPATPATLDACDRLGMLVYNETFDHWDVPKTPMSYPEFSERWEKDLATHVMRDRNHPSVIVWSLGNEITNDPTRGERGHQMAALVRSLDGTRPIGRGGQYDEWSWEYCDFGDEHYITDLTPTRNAHPDKVIIQSESYPTAIHANWAFEQAHPWAIGNFVWTGWDHIGEAGLGTTNIESTDANRGGVALDMIGLSGGIPYPWCLSAAGDIDLIGQAKPQNRWRRVIYGMTAIEMMVERPVPSGFKQDVNGWSYWDELQSWTWAVPDGQLMRVRVYTSAESVTLLLNGEVVATNQLAESDAMTTTFDVPFEPGHLEAVAHAGGQVIGRTSLTTVGPPAAVRLRSDVEALTTSRDDLAHVLVEIVDAEGRLVPDAVTKVAFDVDGAGTLMGVANGNPHNVDSFQRPRRHTWHGQALAVLRPAKQPGQVVISAEADGLVSAALTLAVTSGSA
jgi:beta-galactosidase